MKRSNYLLIAAFAIFTIASLSSFYKKEIPTQSTIQPQEQYSNEYAAPNLNDDRYTDDDKKYNSVNKKQVSNESFNMGAAFLNDYYLNTDREGYFYQEIKAEKYNNREANRTPLNISIVIDRSGSMSGEKIRNVRKAAKEIIDMLTSNDYVSIVIYDSEVDVLHESQRLTNKEVVKNKIDKIYDRSGTNLCGGMQRGFAQAARTYKSGYVNRVLLMSDGLANEGITNANEIGRIARKHLKDENISISTFGVGNDYNEDLMTALAENGAGNYYFINNANDIAKILRKELNGIMEVIARNAELKIQIPDNVKILDVKGASYDQIGRTLQIKFHDIFSQETKGVLVHYKINNTENSPNIFYTTFSYTQTSSNEKRQLSLVNSQEYITNKTAYMDYFNEWVEAQVVLYEVNKRMEDAAIETDRGNYNEARKLVNDNKVYMSKKAKLVEKNAELQKVSVVNDSYTENLKDVETMPAAQFKTMQKATKEEQYKVRTKK